MTQSLQHLFLHLSCGLRQRKRTVTGVALLLLGSAFPVLSPAQTTVDWQLVENASERALQPLYQENAVSPAWVGDSHYLFYDVKEASGRVVYLMNAATGKRERLIKDTDAFVRQYRTLLKDTSITADNLKLYSLRMRNGDARSVYWAKGGKHFVYHRPSGRLALTTEKMPPRFLTPASGAGQRSSSTRDSLFTMLGSRYDLYVRDNGSGAVTRLTHDGKEYASYCSRSAGDSLSAGNAAGLWYGHVYICLVTDDSKVGDLYLINALGKRRPSLRTRKMPLPNEPNVRQFRLFWYDAETRRSAFVPVSRFRDGVVDMSFGAVGNALYFTSRSRAADTLELCRLDLPTGTVRTVIREVCKPHLNLTLFNYHVVDKGRHIIWWSERTGRGNYYLYDNKGTLLNRITRGDRLVAGSIVNIDTLAGTMIFAGYGQEAGIDPYYTYYYKVRLDGRKQQKLCSGNGTHELQLCDDKRFALDSYSRMDLPTVYEVVSVERPQRRFAVARRSDAALRKAGWQPPRLLSLKAADGKTDLYGLMYVPCNLNPKAKYPVISNVYPGPQDDQLPRSFSLDDNGNQSLANMGFIVVSIAPRGSSPLRGRDFYTYGYGRLRDYPLADDKHALETLAGQYPFIDLSRVGIYGHSGGAFMTVAAMLTYPQFYKVGVAASGNHDNNIYIQWWGEVFHGVTGHIPTNMELAGALQGRLMLVSGDVDDNVPYASTLRMADAFIKAGKRFDMMILPGKDHSVWSDYYQNLVRYYFKEHLVVPQKEDIDIIHHQ